jgi:hypothetical protein
LSVPGAYLNTVTATSTIGASANFRATGSTITIFRSTGATMGVMNVFVDGVLWAAVDNTLGGTAVNVPYVIAGLTPTDHTVRIEVVSGDLQLDAVRAANPLALTTGVIVDERNAGVTYGGVWTNTAAPLAYFSTTRVTSAPNATADFSFNGNYFCIIYVQRPDGGNMDVFVNGAYGFTISTSGPQAYKLSWCSTLYAEGIQRVRLVRTSGVIELDAVQPLKQIVITPGMGLVAETNTAFTYNLFYGPWANITGGSPGGYKFQGNAVRRTATSGARLTFWINGTGMILYTSIGPVQGQWEVYVDGVLQNFNLAGVSYPYINLDGTRFSPIGYGIINLLPGQHVIELRAILAGAEFADFDGIRVFP